MIRHPLLLLIVICLILFSYRSWEDAVIFTDELLIEDAVYTMAHGGSLIIPTVDSKPHLVKPPLIYWLISPLYLFFTPSSFLLRLPMIVFGISLVLVSYALAKLWFGKNIAFLSALLLSTSAPLVFFTKTANFDLPNAFFITLSIYFYNKLRVDRRKKRYSVFVGLSLALGILTRSFLALLPLLVMAVDLIFSTNRRFSFLFVICHLSFVILLIFPWHFLASSQERDAFINQYINLPIFLHAAGTVPGDEETNHLFYLRIFLLFPASVFAFLSIKKLSMSSSSASIQLFSWVLIFFGILTLSITRHQWYSLPLFPPLSVLSAQAVNQLLTSLKKGSLCRFLIILFLSASILSSPMALFFNSFKEAETITLTRLFLENSHSTETLYLYRFSLLSKTRFFPGRPVVIVDDDKLSFLFSQKKPFFLLARITDKENIRHPQMISYQGQKFVLYQFIP